MQVELDAMKQLKKRKHSIRVVFIDDGGVLNDNRLRAPEWQRLLSEFLPPRLGGTPTQWMNANRTVFRRLWPELQNRISEFPNYSSFRREYDLQWMRQMCAEVAVDAPADEVSIALAREAAVFIGRQAQTEIEGAANAVRTIHDSGYVVHMASGTASWELDAILSRMGIRHLFASGVAKFPKSPTSTFAKTQCEQRLGQLFGPDLIDRVKHGSQFYEHIFRNVDVAARECLVVESSSECCKWAEQAGAHSICVDCERPETPSLLDIAKTLAR